MGLQQLRSKIQRIQVALLGLPRVRRGEALSELLEPFTSAEKDIALGCISIAQGLWEPISQKQVNVTGVANIEIMEEKIQNTQTISGGTFHGPVGVNQTFTDCFKIAQSAPTDERRAAIEATVVEVQKALPYFPEAERPKAERKLKQLADEAAQPEPDKAQIELSGRGLIEAAQTCAGMAGPVVLCVKALTGLLGIPIF